MFCWQPTNSFSSTSRDFASQTTVEQQWRANRNPIAKRRFGAGARVADRLYPRPSPNLENTMAGLPRVLPTKSGFRSHFISHLWPPYPDTLHAFLGVKHITLGRFQVRDFQ